MNLIGGYRCECASGYRPSPDQKTCVGKNACRLLTISFVTSWSTIVLQTCVYLNQLNSGNADTVMTIFDANEKIWWMGL